MTFLPFGTLPLGMKKFLLFPFVMRVTTPWASLPKFLANAFIHTSNSGTCRNFLSSCDIPVMKLMTVLASNLLHALCALSICVGRAYLGEFCNCGDRRGASGSVDVTLRDGAVVGIGDCSTLRYGSVVCISCDPTLGVCVGALVGSDVTSISCRFLMSCICSSLTTNGDAGDGLLSASSRYSTDWSDTPVDK